MKKNPVLSKRCAISSFRVASVAVFLLCLACRASAAPGLLLVAHGSPNPEWNKPVLEFGNQVAEAVLQKGSYQAVRMGLLESSQPDIPTAIAELEAAGCDRIIALPLFIAPSGHTHFDVPAALGIYASPKTSAAMEAEHAKPAQSRVPITLLQTLSEGDLLQQYALDQVRKLSKSPQEEAIVILAHGDPEHHLLVERLLREVTTYCCGNAGVSYGDWASIGMGQEYATQGLPAIQSALDHKKRVLVVGLYLGTSAASIQSRFAKSAEHGHAAASAHSDKTEVIFSEEPLIRHPLFLARVVDATQKVPGLQ